MYPALPLQVRLLEGHRLFPSKDCALWRVLPADRTSRDARFLLQNMFSNKNLGHDMEVRVRPLNKSW